MTVFEPIPIKTTVLFQQCQDIMCDPKRELYFMKRIRSYIYIQSQSYLLDYMIQCGNNDMEGEYRKGEREIEIPKKWAVGGHRSYVRCKLEAVA